MRKYHQRYKLDLRENALKELKALKISPPAMIVMARVQINNY